MLNKLIVGSLVIFILIFIGLSTFKKAHPQTQTTNPTSTQEAPPDHPSDQSYLISPTIAVSKSTSQPTPKINQGERNIRLAYISVGTNGPIGCGDSLTFSQTSVNSQRVLEAALDLLLSDKSQGGTQRYNALYQSNLSIEKIDLSNGHADVYLTGTTSLGGTCDSPRFKAQLEQTALQFSTVKNVTFFINGRNLDEVLSQK